LRCTEIGLSLGDLEHVTIGMVWDILEEKRKDNNGFIRNATQEDMDKFAKG